MSIVLLGEIGSGKTTFYNKLTDSNEKTYSGGQSQTRLVFMKQSSYGKGFKVIDTPGFGVGCDKLDQVAGVLSALADGPLNRIFYFIRFDRTQMIIKNLKQLLPAFMNYRVMITVVITFWDDCQSEDEQSKKADIEAALKEYQINSVMYARKLDTGETLCRQIDQIIAKTPSQSVDLTEEDIFRNFDIIDFGEDNDGWFFDLEISIREIIEHYKQFHRLAIKLIKEANMDRDEISDYCNAITQFAKNHLDDTIKKFEMENLNTIDQLSEIDKLRAFQLVLQLKIKIFEDYENIVQHALTKANKTANYFTNYIRKCQYCGQIWILNKGCGGTTICGRLIDSKQDDSMSHGIPTRYLVEYKNRKLQITLKERRNNTPIDHDSIAKNLQKNYKSQSQLKDAKDSKEKIGIGCGRWIEWEKMIQLNEDELNEILQIMDETLKDQIEQQEENIKDRTQKIQSRYQHELQAKIAEKRQQTQRDK